jgi:parallel beta-helix repeat protein
MLRITVMLLVFSVCAANVCARTVTVPDDFNTISAAISKLTDGDCIYIKPGIYKETLTLRHTIHLEGSDANRVIIEAPFNRMSLFVTDCNGLKISNLSLRQAGPMKSKTMFAALMLNKAKMAAQNCVFSDSGIGIHLARDSKIEIRNCRIEHNRSGIRISSNGSYAVITDSKISDNVQTGIGGYGDYIIKNCEINNNEYGVYSGKKSQKVELYGNIILRNSKYGICLDDVAHSVLTDNICAHNGEDGIYVLTDGNTRIEKNRCRGNAKSGISVGHKVKGEVIGNLCWDNGGFGVSAWRSYANIAIKNNRCINNVECGISLIDCNNVTIEGNLCKGNNDTGIAVNNSHEVICSGNESCFNDECGIAFFGEARGQVKQNKSYNNAHNGIYISAKGTRAQVFENQCSRNYYSGIVIANGASGIITKNQCNKNAWAGISLSGIESTAVIKQNSCSDNGDWGLTSWKVQRLTIAGNDLKNNPKGQKLQL